MKLHCQILLTREQTQALLESMPPAVRWRDTWVVVAAIRPSGEPELWKLDISALPGERRDAIRAACAGELKLKRKRETKKDETPVGAGGES